MKRFITFSLSTLLVVFTAATAQAQTPLRLQSLTIAATPATQISNAQLSPADLVSFARRGSFKAQGIPSYAAFDNDYAVGKITPESLIKSAIATNRLTPEALNDRSYLQAVDVQLMETRSEGL
jgi:hypothetical protein